MSKRLLPGTRALRTFEAAGRHLNFTRAAEEVGLTPAAVSYQIKEMEGQMGMELFVRSSRSIRLTPAGTIFFEAAGDALETLQRAAGRARKMARGSSVLRLSLGARFATNWLLPRLSRLREAVPSLELTFDITDEVRDFELDDVDVAIRFGSGGYLGTRSARLFETTVVPVCSPALLEAGPDLKAPRDLLNHTLCHVDCHVGGQAWPNWPMWMAAAGIDDFDPSHCVAFSEASHVVQAVLEGGAVGLAEPAMIESELRQGRLVTLFDIELAVMPAFAYYLVYPESGQFDPRLLAFRQWLLDEAHASSGGAVGVGAPAAV
ncbi:LysR substrate-binding domain-containing protein [Billgrantia montanilacus]|uniref:LysR family transcriptional regulator n=1 Tax=Billgrantia montanilacus TaxID=2282305 RepID=A0A368TUU9_9GAMM|nr:LysR substrate-binding domain-containing protein [Halomonas montanilacus]RCV88464.1 LysR family transcriptional regulator [Halomonas montanilacus]